MLAWNFFITSMMHVVFLRPNTISFIQLEFLRKSISYRKSLEASNLSSAMHPRPEMNQTSTNAMRLFYQCPGPCYLEDHNDGMSELICRIKQRIVNLWLSLRLLSWDTKLDGCFERKLTSIETKLELFWERETDKYNFVRTSVAFSRQDFRIWLSVTCDR